MTNRPADKQVTYMAISLFSSRTFWFNAVAGLVAILALPEVVAIIPSRYLPAILAVSAAGNMVLRMTTVRPAAIIAPGDTKPIAVKRIDAPAPPPKLGD